MDTMLRLFGTVTRIISVKELWQACGAENASYLRRIWEKPAVVQFMKDNRISRRGNSLIKS